jgi:crotonobetainyl-CoA:carnitine CoA-transferase CaiB-like acyl-CoA transferase
MMAIGRPDMTTANEKYATDSKRCEVQEEICDEIEKFVSENTAEYVMKVMNEARVPSGPILSIEDIVHEEQYQVRGMFESVKTPEDDANGVHCTIPAMLPVLSKTRGRTLWAGPALGHHTDEILKTELEMGDAEIESLRTSGVI